MRHTWKTSPWTVVFLILGVLVAAVVIAAYGHARSEQRYLFFAVTRQVDAHASQIETLLSEVNVQSAFRVEEAVFNELQRPPSTTLITRNMVSVRPSTGSVWQCLIDLSSLRLPVRVIQGSTKQQGVNAPEKLSSDHVSWE